MHITCPSCRAEYEISAIEIDVGGRVVECSACGHRWLQPSLRVDDAPSPPLRRDMSAGREKPEVPDMPTRREMPGLSAAAESLAALRRPEGGAPAANSSVAVAPAANSPAANASAANASAASSSAANSQAANSQAANSQAANASSGVAPAPPPAATPGPVTPPVMIPPPPRTGAGLGEIDARSLSAQLRGGRGDVVGSDQDEDAPRRSRVGFVAGFALALLLGAIAAGVYLEPGRVTALSPEAAPLVERYVAAVDEARRMVEAGLAALRDAVDPLVGRVREMIAG